MSGRGPSGRYAIEYVPKACRNAGKERFELVCEEEVGRNRAGFVTCQGCADSLKISVVNRTQEVWRND